MIIEKSKWYNNADAPVTFMIDDLANVWIDLNGNGKIDLEEDWGHAMKSENSAFRFLEDEILADFPAVKTTFFVPLNRKPLLSDHDYNAHFGPVDETPDLQKFFYDVHNSDRYEAAYHGITHGISGTKERGFVHEWRMYKTLEEALITIAEGREFFKKVFGEYPAGGKYCGYQTNDFSDKSIDKSGFRWWCRKWNRIHVDIPDDERFNIRYFGDNNVIDIPSTIAGNLFSFNPRNFAVNLIKKLLGRSVTTFEDVLNEGYSQLENLLKNNYIISVQEHISPSRTDGKRQITNIVDDKDSLIRIFEYLKDKNIWYATISEIADYFELYQNTSIRMKEGANFEFEYTGRATVHKELTILLSGEDSPFEIESPSGKLLKKEVLINEKKKQYLTNLEIEPGVYKVISQ
jgi:hypothetical protein